MNKRLPRPLLVGEDNNEDFMVLERIIQDMGLPNLIYRCADGDEVLDYLYREGDYQNPTQSPRPGVLLLDLNLPGTDGREVLQQLRQDSNLQNLPVVIFTTSSNPKDIEFCYRHGANGYLIKPMDFNQLKQTVQMFVGFWLSTNVSPKISE